MNTVRLRALIRKYGDIGILLVACYIGLYHLWTKRRQLMGACLLLLGLLVLLWSHRASTTHTRLSSVAPKQTTATPNIPASAYYHPQRPLLRQATKIVSLTKRYEEYCWFSNDKLLLITRHQDQDYRELTDWQGKAELLNLATGRRAQLRGLTRLLNCIHGTPGRFELSPDGSWLNWIRYQTGDGWPDPVAARLDGSGFQDWQQDKGSYTYWLDGHCWAEQETHNYEDREELLDLIVHDADTRTKQRFRVHSKRAQELMRHRYQANVPVFEASSEDEDKSASTTTIKEYTAAEYYRSDYAAPEPRPLHTTSVRLPAGASIKEVLVTPAGRRVVYKLGFDVVPVLHNPPSEPAAVCDLWVSKVDGSALREMGYVPISVDEESADNLTELRWLPGGKRLSFVYQKVLYTIPTD